MAELDNIVWRTSAQVLKCVWQLWWSSSFFWDLAMGQVTPLQEPFRSQSQFEPRTRYPTTGKLPDYRQAINKVPDYRQTLEWASDGLSIHSTQRRQTQTLGGHAAHSVCMLHLRALGACRQKNVVVWDVKKVAEVVRACRHLSANSADGCRWSQRHLVVRRVDGRHGCY